MSSLHAPETRQALRLRHLHTEDETRPIHGIHRNVGVGVDCPPGRVRRNRRILGGTLRRKDQSCRTSRAAAPSLRSWRASAKISTPGQVSEESYKPGLFASGVMSAQSQLTHRLEALSTSWVLFRCGRAWPWSHVRASPSPDYPSLPLPC